jgi:hypothetical protein
MKRQHCAKVYIRQIIPIQDEKRRAISNPGFVGQERTCASQKSRLMKGNYLQAAGLVVIQKIIDLFMMPMRVDNHFINPVPFEMLQPDAQEWSATDRQKALGDFICKGTQPCPKPCRQKKCSKWFF